MGRRFHAVPAAMRSEIVRLAVRGMSMRAIARETSIGQTSVRRVLRPFGGVFRGGDEIVEPGGLTVADRVEVQIGVRGEGERW